MNTVTKKIRGAAAKVLCLCATAIALHTGTYAIEVGELASEISLQSNNGSTVQLSQLKGKVVFVDFWASWCGSCAQSIPWLNSLQEKLGADNFQVLAVNLDENSQDADKFLKEAHANLLVAYDPKGTTPESFHVKAMPSSFLLDRNGKVVFIHEGFSAKDRESLESQIQNIIKS